MGEEELSDASLELPRIDYGERNGRPYRYLYGVGAHEDGDSPDFVDRLVKIDVENGEEPSWFEPGSTPASRCSSPRPSPTAARTRACCSPSSSTARSGSSFLLVLDARTLTEVGRAQVPHHIPFGFHGQFFD